MSYRKPISSSHDRGPELQIGGRRIREDANGHVCLNDIYEIAGKPKNQQPAQWRRLPSTNKLILALIKRMGKSHSGIKLTEKTAAYFRRGAQPGAYAHPILAAAYAGYLSADLEVEVRAVYLRYRAGDASLADEILQRASPEANRWAAVRAMGRAARKEFTDTLAAHGATNRGFALATNAIYIQLLGNPAHRLRIAFGLKKKDDLRDSFQTDQLSYVSASEALATERIRDEDCRGDGELEAASGKSAGFIREAIERDRASRLRRASPAAAPQSGYLAPPSGKPAS